MSQRDDIREEIEKSDDGRQTIDRTAERVVEILGLGRSDTDDIRLMLGMSGLDSDELAEEIMLDYGDDDEYLDDEGFEDEFDDEDFDDDEEEDEDA
jgi:hypothetical protein